MEIEEVLDTTRLMPWHIHLIEQWIAERTTRRGGRPADADRIYEEAMLFATNKAGELCGFLSFYETEDYTVFLHSAYVLPEHRGKGYYKKMIKYLKKMYKGSLFKQIDLICLSDNHSGHTAHKRLGFEDVSINMTMYL